MSCADLVSSTTAITRASEVSFTSVMISLLIGASTRLTTCSSVTLKKIWLSVMPSTCPASFWPLGMLWMPPR